MRARTKLAIPALAALLLALLAATVAHAGNAGEVVYPNPDEHSSVPHLEEPPDDRGPPPETRIPHGTPGSPAGDEAPGPGAETEVEEGDRPGPAGTDRGEKPATGESGRSPGARSIDDNRPATGDGPSPAKLIANPTDSSDDDGGSSPILPILIAIAALAVLSAGVAFYNEHFRSRRS